MQCRCRETQRRGVPVGASFEPFKTGEAHAYRRQKSELEKASTGFTAAARPQDTPGGSKLRRLYRDDKWGYQAIHDLEMGRRGANTNSSGAGVYC